ncbi:MAG: hypothetical protein NT007_09195 [Candidatus Kapabacteria bacterium]|nr:hypothetical protein [Candidatus Kapabacteria bacterium]
MDAKKFGLKVFRIKYYYLWLIFWLFTIALRYYIFGELLTNPIIAKSSPIFKTEPFLSNHLNPFLSILKTYSPFIILSIYLIIKEKRFAINLKFFDTSTLLIICGIIFNLIIGNNFGPPDRMFYPVIPFIIIFIYSSLGSNFLKITKNRIILGLIFIIFVSYNIYSVQTKQAISVMKVKEINEGIEQIQKLSAKQKITYAGPDMGGIMLFGNNLRIIDIAGLCNKFIAKNGYKDFDKYIFDIEKPDIIEIHEGWTSLSGIKNSERLYLNYSLYIFKGFALFIKNEIIQSLINKNLVDSLMYIPQSDISNADSVILNKFQKYKILKY